jgi:hypothetical protein
VTEAPAAPPKACSILKRADIEPVVGASVTKFAKEQDTPKSATICNWDIGAPASGALVSVWVQRGKDARKGYKDAVRVFGQDAEQLGDLGSRAFYSPRAGTAYVLDGSTLLYVQRLDATGATDVTALRDQAVQLTELALGRL